MRLRIKSSHRRVVAEKFGPDGNEVASTNQIDQGLRWKEFSHVRTSI
jgi:hypothetical protein